MAKAKRKIKRITLSAATAICRGHKRGESIFQLARRFGISWGRIKTILEAGGVRPAAVSRLGGKKSGKARRSLKKAAEAHPVVEVAESLDVRVAKMEAAIDHIRQLLAMAQQTLDSIG